MLHIWYKTGCSTCRKALDIIQDNCSDGVELYEYLKERPTQKDIRALLKMLGLKAEELVRKKEALYREKYSSKKLTNAEWIKVLAANPQLIERPVIIKDNKAYIGRPPERILEYLGEGNPAQ